MALPRGTVLQVLDIVAHLGGPECTAEEIEWATDLPPGKTLLEWLTTQVPDIELHLASGTSGITGCDDQSVLLRAALSPIALYSEELETMPALSSSEHDADTSCASYELPAQLRTRAECTRTEVNLLERQSARLQHRLKATKRVQKDLKQAIHTRRKQIQATDDTLAEQQQNLAELSTRTDSSAARHRDFAISAIQNAIPPSRGPTPLGYVEEMKSEVAALSDSRAAVSGAVKHLHNMLDDGYASLPSSAELERAVRLLNTKVKVVTTKGPIKKLSEAAYVEELEKMAKRLEESDDGPGQLNQMLGLSTSSQGPRHVTVDVDVKRELERAGRMDRSTLLHAQDRGLDLAISYMQDDLMPKLQTLFDDLHAHSSFTAETETIVSALIEELEDVNDAMDSTERGYTPHADIDPDGLLEEEIKELLKRKLGAYEGNNGPTVLLDRADVRAQLTVLAERRRASEVGEETWVSELQARLGARNLSSGSGATSLLTTAYSNSPVNTSGPFSSSRMLKELQKDTRAKAEELIDAAARLQKDTELSSRDKRKLGTFVEKWVASHRRVT